MHERARRQNDAYLQRRGPAVRLSTQHADIRIDACQQIGVRAGVTVRSPPLETSLATICARPAAPRTSNNCEAGHPLSAGGVPRCGRGQLRAVQCGRGREGSEPLSPISSASGQPAQTLQWGVCVGERTPAVCMHIPMRRARSGDARVPARMHAPAPGAHTRPRPHKAAAVLVWTQTELVVDWCCMCVAN